MFLVPGFSTEHLHSCKNMSSNKVCNFAFYSLVFLFAFNKSSGKTLPTPMPVKSNLCPEDCHCFVLKDTYHKEYKTENGVTVLLPLHSIDFSHIGLAKFSHQLEKLRDVTSIDLSHNYLTEIGHLGRRVKKLNLRHNKITSHGLGKLPLHVQHLDLSHNELTFLPLELTKLTNLQSIELSHNNINCSCETLDVRNWLQKKHVFTEHHVKCTYPSNLKGKSWLQIKQSDICDQEKNKWIDLITNENELMLGDQPIVDSSAELGDDVGELGKDFLPLKGKSLLYKQKTIAWSKEEGSGEKRVKGISVEAYTTETPTDTHSVLKANGRDLEDEFGSGMSPIMITHLKFGKKNREKEAESVSYPPEHRFGNGLGIVQFHDVAGSLNRNDIIEENINPLAFDKNHVNSNFNTTVAESAQDPTSIKVFEKPSSSANGEISETKATFYLMGFILIVLVGLVLFVVIKRSKASIRKYYNVESPCSTELLNMDKRHPGKPINGKATENSSLISEETNEDGGRIAQSSGVNISKYCEKDIEDKSRQHLLLNGIKRSFSTENCNENNINVDSLSEQPMTSENIQVPKQYDINHRIISRYPTPKSLLSISQNACEREVCSFPPSSFLSSRYSPVYSTKTGRVKIKLIETPNPRTPMLVTRRKSNSGDFITTQIDAENISNMTNIPEIYQTRIGMTLTQ